MNERAFGKAARQQGLTLIELLIAMAIGGILLGVVTAMLLQFNVLTRVHQESLTISQQLQQTASLLNRDVVGAVSGEVIATGDDVTLTLEIWAIPEEAFGKRATPVPRQVTYFYDASEQVLTRVSPEGNHVVARRVSALDLGPSRTLTSTLWVTMTVSGQGQSQQMTLELHRRPNGAE